MPKILESKKVLGGRGTVFTYSDRNIGCYFYRERIEGTKKYRTKSIKGAKTLSEAEEMAMEIAIALRDDEPHHLSASVERRVADLSADELLEREEKLIKKKERMQRLEIKNGRKSISIDNAVNDYLKGQKKRVDAGTFSESSYSHKFYCFRHIQAYLKDYKGFTRTSQINETTFDDYLVYRSGTTRIVQNRELAVLGEWIKSYLVRHKYISSDLWLKGNFLPKVHVRDVDRMANPAINPDDWKAIVDYVRDKWRIQPTQIDSKKDGLVERTVSDPRTVYWRNMFWHYILFSKNTGMSPEEVLKLKWKNVEIRDVGRISYTKMEQDIKDVEEEGIGDAIGTVDEFYDAATGGDPNAWAGENPEQLGREERLVAYITTIRSKTKQPREIPCNQGVELRRWIKFLKTFTASVDIDHTFIPNDYVFANPLNEFKPPHQNRIGRTWRLLIRQLQAEGKLKGHKFSDKPYTLYSMRSTFIEDHLIKGTDIFLLARIAGHDVKTLMQSYERMDIRKRAEEITNIQYGKRSTDKRVVNLLDD